MTGESRGGFRDRPFGEPIVVVSGLPRSGTSMVMNMLEAGGMAVVSDGLRAADDNNPLGYFEDERVKRLDRDGDRQWLSAARGKAIKIISFLLRELPDTHNYRVVFMHRDLAEVLESQRKMLADRGAADDVTDERMARAYRDHLREVAAMLQRSPRFESIEVAYAEVVSRPAEQAARLAAFIGRPLDVPKMAAQVDAGLYRNRRDGGRSLA